MIYIGIDVAKDKHDCFITNSEGEVLFNAFTIPNNADAHTIALMMMSGVNLQSYSDTSYHNEDLKSLTRYRFDKVKERAKLKTSVSRLVNILFPELENLYLRSIWFLSIRSSLNFRPRLRFPPVV